MRQWTYRDVFIKWVLQMDRMIFLSLEATGLYPYGNPTDRLIEVAAFEVINGVLTERVFHQYINPEIALTNEVKEFLNVSEFCLNNRPVFGDISDELFSCLQGSIVVMHYAKFDIDFLDSEFLGIRQDWQSLGHYCEIIDTYAWAKQLEPNKKCGLSSISERYNLRECFERISNCNQEAHFLFEIYNVLKKSMQEKGLPLIKHTNRYLNKSLAYMNVVQQAAWESFIATELIPKKGVLTTPFQQTLDGNTIHDAAGRHTYNCLVSISEVLVTTNNLDEAIVQISGLEKAACDACGGDKYIFIQFILKVQLKKLEIDLCQGCLESGLAADTAEIHRSDEQGFFMLGSGRGLNPIEAKLSMHPYQLGQSLSAQANGHGEVKLFAAQPTPVLCDFEQLPDWYTTALENCENLLGDEIMYDTYDYLVSSYDHCDGEVSLIGGFPQFIKHPPLLQRIVSTGQYPEFISQFTSTDLPLINSELSFSLYLFGDLKTEFLELVVQAESPPISKAAREKIVSAFSKPYNDN